MCCQQSQLKFNLVAHAVKVTRLLMYIIIHQKSFLFYCRLCDPPQARILQTRILSCGLTYQTKIYGKTYI